MQWQSNLRTGHREPPDIGRTPARRRRTGVAAITREVPTSQPRDSARDVAAAKCEWALRHVPFDGHVVRAARADTPPCPAVRSGSALRAWNAPLSGAAR
ncbi:hypothetical protein GCM10009764_34440 [Nocardia ninae]|uniref:Uncharacterized protein n=1 Tax=Nocardia ninae NBRC 108245 TaxID=1210091 RepID=A0A511MQX1_9NOCA|nr:hypothetical protein NN4_74790 [Nocardia ninae NBRC 108245]